MDTETTTRKFDFFKRKEEKAARPKIPDADVQALRYEIRQGNQYSLEATQTRNVLIVGRTRSGKSTAVGVLKDPCHEPKEMSIFSDTVDPKFQSFSLDDKRTSVKYTVNVIDTPGLKEVRKMGEDPRSDLVILNTINYCMKNEITKINCLLIFVSFELGVTKDDLDSFQTFIENFDHEDISIGICVTRSEDKTDRWQTQVFEELRQHCYFSKILARNNVSVLFCGCVDALKNETITNIDDLVHLYQRVYDMRAKLVNFVFEAEKQAKFIELPIACGLKKTLMETFAEQFDILSYLDGQADLGTSACQNKIEDFRRNIESFSNASGTLTDEELMGKFLEMKSRMGPLMERMTAEQKARFSSNLVFMEV